jgi:hypothetical protein
LQATGLSVGRAATALLDIYSAAANAEGQCVAGATDKRAMFQCVGEAGANDVYAQLWAFGSTYGAGTYGGVAFQGNTFLTSYGSAAGFGIGTVDAKSVVLFTNNTAALTIDSARHIFLSTVRSGATQAAAGAAATELWKTSGHATLPDNVVMIGV